MFFLMIVVEWAAQQVYAVKKMKGARSTNHPTSGGPPVSPYNNRIMELLNCVGVGAAQQLFAFTFEMIGVLTDVGGNAHRSIHASREQITNAPSGLRACVRAAACVVLTVTRHLLLSMCAR